VQLEGADAAAIETEGLTLWLRSFGGTLTTEAGHYAPRFGERLECPVLALHKGASPEFGYALARTGVPLRIDAAGAEVAGRAIARRSRRPPPAGE
jgi:hypothetical protein